MTAALNYYRCLVSARGGDKETTQKITMPTLLLWVCIIMCMQTLAYQIWSVCVFVCMRIYYVL